jgi:hypothetical protein
MNELRNYDARTPMSGYEPVEDLVKEYKPKRQEILRDHEIGIRFLSIGCVIRVGCKEIPFTNVDEAMKELNNYIKNPYEEGKRWNKLFDTGE